MSNNCRRARAVVLGIAAVTAITTATLSAAASPSASAQAIVAPARVKCLTGDTLITPTRERTDALGVRFFTFGAVPGMVTKLPPLGLTASQATPALLADSGVPLPASSARLAAGGEPARAASAARRQAVVTALALSNHGAPEYCLADAAHRHLFGGQDTQAPAPSLLRYDHAPSGQWGGWGITEGEWEAVNSVQGEFIVGKSTTTPPSPKAPMGESTWVGLGGQLYSGDNNAAESGLVQSGVSMLTNPGSVGPAGFTSWYEVLGGSGNQGCNGNNNDCDPIYNMADTTHSGDDVKVDVSYTSASQVCFVLTDYTHSTGSMGSNCVVVAKYDHTSAEWVNENFLSSGFYYDNPGTIQFKNQLVAGPIGSSWVNAFSVPYEGVIMTVRSDENEVQTCPVNSVLSEGESISGTTSSQIVTNRVSGCDT